MMKYYTYKAMHNIISYVLMIYVVTSLSNAIKLNTTV